MQRRHLWLTAALVSLVLSSGIHAEERHLGGARLVVLKGTHYERGMAHGAALHAEIVDLVDNYLAPKVSVPQMFFVMLDKIAPLMDVEESLKEEAQGIIDGARKANGGTFRSRYQDKDFTWQQVLALSTYVDYIGTACSSVSAWGEATEKSSLKGQSALARNLDWSLSPKLLRNQVVFVHIPAEEGEVPFVSVGFAGFIGCLSCLNERGLGAFLNLGYGNRTGTYPPDRSYVPAALAFRSAIENGRSGDKLLDDFVTRLTAGHHVGSFIIHAIAPRSGSNDAAVVVEMQGDKHSVRRAGDDAGLKQPVLIATNHHRKAAEPVRCHRYSTGKELAGKLEGTVTPDALWSILDEMRRSDTMQRMLFVPATGEFRLAILKPSKEKAKSEKKFGSSAFAPVETVFLKDLFKLTP